MLSSTLCQCAGHQDDPRPPHPCRAGRRWRLTSREPFQATPHRVFTHACSAANRAAMLAASARSCAHICTASRNGVTRSGSWRGFAGATINSDGGLQATSTLALVQPPRANVKAIAAALTYRPRRVESMAVMPHPRRSAECGHNGRKKSWRFRVQKLAAIPRRTSMGHEPNVGGLERLA